MNIENTKRNSRFCIGKIMASNARIKLNNNMRIFVFCWTVVLTPNDLTLKIGDYVKDTFMIYNICLTFTFYLKRFFGL